MCKGLWACDMHHEAVFQGLGMRAGSPVTRQRAPARTLMWFLLGGCRKAVSLTSCLGCTLCGKDAASYASVQFFDVYVMLKMMRHWFPRPCMAGVDVGVCSLCSGLPA
jgi:hypothetical protein